MKSPVPVGVLLMVLAAGCEQTQTAPVPGLQTVETTEVPAMAIEPPPQVNEQESIIKPKINPFASPEEQKAQIAAAGLDKTVSLPFAPAIAMDSVDGSKVSIRADTPMLEYQKKLYYFQTVENKRAFEANPEQFVKGTLARY